jgi:hypothetical protein
MKLLGELKKISKEPRKLIQTFLFYAAIFIAAFAIGKMFSPLVGQRQLFSLFLVIAYFLVLVFVYSFFKLGIIESISKNKLTKKSFSLLGSFFLFNLVALIFGSIIVVLASSFISYSLNDSVIAGLTFIGIFLIFYYPFLNFSQFEFLEKRKIFKSLGYGWKTIFSVKILSYFKIVLVNVIVIAAYFLLFYLIGNLYKIAFIKNNPNPATYIGIYNTTFILLLAIVLVLMLSLNIQLLRKIKE